MGDDFARLLGDALLKFLAGRNITQTQAAKIIEVEKATLNTYFRDNRKGKRARANAETLVQACIQLGFQFEYKGHLIAASKIGQTTKPKASTEQLSFNYQNQFYLTEDRGSVEVALKRRPSGRVEILVALKAIS